MKPNNIMHSTDEPTLSMVTEAMRKKGFKSSFTMEANDETIKCIETEKEYTPADMQIVKLRRFEGESDPGDNSIVYAVKCNDGQKGIIIAAYGMYGSARINQFMKEVEIDESADIAGPISQRA